MRTFEITDKLTGKSYGKYVADNEENAIREMLADVRLNQETLNPPGLLRWVNYDFTATEIE